MQKQVDSSSCGPNTPSGSDAETDAPKNDKQMKNVRNLMQVILAVKQLAIAIELLTAYMTVVKRFLRR